MLTVRGTAAHTEMVRLARSFGDFLLALPPEQRVVAEHEWAEEVFAHMDAVDQLACDAIRRLQTASRGTPVVKLPTSR